MSSLAQVIAEGSMVLLKNENRLLPLSPGAAVSVFGRAQIKTVFSGNGSGGSAAEGASILDALTALGITDCDSLADFYRKNAAVEPYDGIDWDMIAKSGNSGLAYEIFGKYRAPAEEYRVPDSLMKAARAHSDTAVLIIGRSAGGEECDRRLLDDYIQTDSETALIMSVCDAFEHVALVLNINGLVDIGFVEKYPNIESIIFMGAAGEDGGRALAEIVTGKVSPSGKLAFTMAAKYEDYPSAEDFSWDKDAPLTYESYGLEALKNGSKNYAKSPVTVYREGIYAGYRYYDTFGVKPLFPFGHGLSYTEFSVCCNDCKISDGAAVLTATVSNIGSAAGRETVQLYVSQDVAVTDHPTIKLCGFEKTRLLLPGESQTLSIVMELDELASYIEKSSAWIIEKGVFSLRLGTSSDKLITVEKLAVPEDITIRRCESRMSLNSCNVGKISFVSRDSDLREKVEGAITVRKYDVSSEKAPMKAGKFYDLSDYSDLELASLCVGYGPGIPFASLSKVPLPNTVKDESGNNVSENDHPKGLLGYVSPAIPSRGIHSAAYMDGPAGVGGVLWPSEMLISCSFDRELWYRFGDAVGGECEERQIDVWLAPAVNLHRNPLCGRNFEYFSEDPLLSGICAVEIVRGVQENHPVIACPKHFAANEQETFRRGSSKKNYDAVDSVISERALREVYLKPFEMLVRKAHISCIMTSFNKINGTFAAGSKDLCTHILREEWGFEGAVVTDWGDMDTVVDGADAVAAGNDIVMPGGPPVIEQILKGLDEGRVTRDELETAVSDLFRMLSVFKKAPCTGDAVSRQVSDDMYKS